MSKNFNTLNHSKHNVMGDFKDIEQKVQEIAANRNIPQFLFASGIHYGTSLLVRDVVLKYKIANPDSTEIDFIIESPGGNADEAYRIIRTLKKNFETVNVIIPFWAKSAATLLSLGGDKIIMDEFGELGPLDVQLAKERDDSPDYESESALNDEYSLLRMEMNATIMYHRMFLQLYNDDNVKINKIELSKQLLKYTSDFYQPILQQINPYKIGEKKRSLEIGQEYAQKVLFTFHEDLIVKPAIAERLQQFIDYLVNKCPTHGFIIDYDFIKLYLPYVFLSSQINDNYASLLRELSVLFMYNENLGYSRSYIKIIAPEISDKADLNHDNSNGLLNGKELHDSVKQTSKRSKKTEIQPS